MKTVKLSIAAIISTMNFIYAGGDISPITPYEVTDMEEAERAAIEVTQKEAILIPPKEVVEPHQEEPISRGNTGIYLGLGGSIARYDTNCDCPTSRISGTDTTSGVIAKIGYDINQYIGVEARGISTMLKDDGAKVTHYGAYLKPMLPLTETLNAYGLVGYGSSETTGSLRKSDVDGLAWGLGADYDITNNVSAFIDYEKLINKSDSNAPKLDTINVGANYNF